MLMKPLPQLEQLRDCLSAFGKAFTVPQGYELNTSRFNSEPTIWFLNSGSVFLYRQEDDLLIDVINSPWILGIVSILYPQKYYYTIVTNTPCQGFSLSLEKARELINSHQLWESLSIWLSYIVRSLELRDMRFVGASCYSQIRTTLLTMEQWNPGMREKIGVISFIQKKTKISRSVIAEMLSALRKGGYIEMNKGKLVSVNRLPQQY
ncbi:helix-turn-helix domain-containing protein [Dryocola sp. BD626]|uniref:helix-turn-helix domain-containing protein n=1 Tax=Dryocola sp. BD626 TaxID=3133273 RepID=UPI003F5010F4